jgi:phospholipase A1
MRLNYIALASSVAVLTTLHFGVAGVAAAEESALDRCLVERVKSAPDNVTLGNIRALCQEQIAAQSAVAEGRGLADDGVMKRLNADRENLLKPFTLMAHKPNYLLFGAYNRQSYNTEEYEGFYDEDEDWNFDDIEAQFQISIKTPLAINLLSENVSLWAGYTVRSFWQCYNTDLSSPFRETNHEPEVWLQQQSDFEIFGFKNTVNLLGVVHQSNGRSGTLSRSWNRVYGAMVFHRGNLAAVIKPWVRIQEETEDDDNPDITDYLGHGELGLAYTWRDHTFSLMSRNNIESGFSSGAVEMGWSFPLYKYPFVKGYIQYFSGYGESLIDYDKYVNKIAAGVLLTDFL